MFTKSKPANASRRRFLKTASCPPSHHMTPPPALNAGALKQISISNFPIMQNTIFSSLFGVSTMSIRIALSAAAMTVVMTQAASAAPITFTNKTLWNNFVVAQGKTFVTETFNSYNGFYANGLTGNTGGIQWTATAPGNLYTGLGYMSTNSPEALLTFNLSPSVQGAAGNFFSTDASFNIISAILGVTLADGSAYLGYTASAADFIGFYSTGAAISSISVSVAGNLPAGTNFATVDNLYLVPTTPPTPPTSSVPEGGIPLVMLGLGFLGVATLRRKLS